MYSFQINFIDRDLSQEILEDVPNEGIALYSDLDILISCLRQNLIKELSLSLTSQGSFEMALSSLAKIKKQDLFKSPWPKDPFELDLKIVLDINTITDEQFLILSEILKNSDALKKINLYLNQALPLTQENPLIQAICMNQNIANVFVAGFISKESKTLMAECTHLKLIAYSIHDAKNIQALFDRHEELLSQVCHEKDISQQASKMFYAQVLLMTVGIVSLAGAMVLMNSILASVGACALALGVYSYFNDASNKNEHMPPQRHITC
jgi:hypothetical protein